jgi:hypothetical protein
MSDTPAETPANPPADTPARPPTPPPSIPTGSPYPETLPLSTYAAPPRPSTPQPKEKRKQLDRDTRLQILTLRSAGFTYSQICNFFKPPRVVTYRAVQTTCESGRASPGKKTGRKPILTSEQVRENRITIFAKICIEVRLAG